MFARTHSVFFNTMSQSSSRRHTPLVVQLSLCWCRVRPWFHSLVQLRPSFVRNIDLSQFWDSADGVSVFSQTPDWVATDRIPGPPKLVRNFALVQSSWVKALSLRRRTPLPCSATVGEPVVASSPASPPLRRSPVLLQSISMSSAAAPLLALCQGGVRASSNRPRASVAPSSSRRVPLRRLSAQDSWKVKFSCSHSLPCLLV